MIRVGLTGAAGRMGTTIARLVHETEGMQVTAAVERPGHPAVGRDAGEMTGVGPLGFAVTDDLAAATQASDVIIDFTSAEASLRHIDVVAGMGKTIVVGSTGFTPQMWDDIRARTEGRIFIAPNMSVGMNVLYRLVEEAARLLGDPFDVEIIETHHRFKKDAPSGSAKRLAEVVSAALERDAAKDCVHGRLGMVGERTPKEIGVHAVRAGDVVGDHTVVFGGLGERIELTHRATSRENFARGAVRATLWITQQPPGVYDMMDLLGLK